MKIRIDHIDKIEGHAGFVANILKGDVKSAKIETEEGARLIEGILIGRHFNDAPIITARICGVCPIVHNIAAIKAIENALEIKVSPAAHKLRRIMLMAQNIHSHSLHLFFLSLSDYFDIANDIKLAQKYSVETEKALKVREFGLNLARIIGGRTVHPIASVVGGFQKEPDSKELENVLKQKDKALQAAIDLFYIFKNLDYENLDRKTQYISLKNNREYPFYEGDIGGNFVEDLKESNIKGEKVKRVKYKGQPFMLGAISRLNNNYQNLNVEASKLLQQVKSVFPFNNVFYNILAQAIELVHCIEEVSKLSLDLKLPKNLKCKINISSKKKEGTAVLEAPRGVLIHSYELDNKGYIKNCNIITPTAQILTNLEEDIKSFLPNITELKEEEMKKKIRMLIRAYDPCITCSTH